MTSEMVGLRTSAGRLAISVEHDSERPDVGAMIHALPRACSGSCRRGANDDRRGRLGVSVVNFPRWALVPLLWRVEVEELYLAVGVI
jgi:hypothetical protein